MYMCYLIILHVVPKTGNIYYDRAPRYGVERLMRPASAEDCRLRALQHTCNNFFQLRFHFAFLT